MGGEEWPLSGGTKSHITMTQLCKGPGRFFQAECVANTKAAREGRRHI